MFFYFPFEYNGQITCCPPTRGRVQSGRQKLDKVFPTEGILIQVFSYTGFGRLKEKGSPQGGQRVTAGSS